MEGAAYIPVPGNWPQPLLLINNYQNALVEDESDGFYIVKRHNNPLRKYGLVHRELGKIEPVEPEMLVRLASKLVNGALPFKDPLVLGLSESSILLGRVVSEFFGGGLFLFSTRYPHERSEMVPFTEPHSHAPSQFLKLNGAGQPKEVCIIEDEVTTGNTVMNLVQVLSRSLPSVSSVAVLALKLLCTDNRIAEMSAIAKTMGINFSIHSLFRDSRSEDTPVRFTVKGKQQETEDISHAGYSEWEAGRGRIDTFNKEKAVLRYKKWDSVLSKFNLPGTVTVIGASEAIDLAFEISRVLSLKGQKAFLRHLTISPWEVPGWTFPPAVPGTRPLHLYMPPHGGSTTIIVYDQPFQEEQVNKLSACLQNIGSKTYIFKGLETC